mgnify:FL=1
MIRWIDLKSGGLMSHSECVPLPCEMLLVATVCFTETFLETFANRSTKGRPRVFQEAPMK